MKDGKLIFFSFFAEKQKSKKANFLILKRFEKLCGLRQSVLRSHVKNSLLLMQKFPKKTHAKVSNSYFFNWKKLCHGFEIFAINFMEFREFISLKFFFAFAIVDLKNVKVKKKYSKKSKKNQILQFEKRNPIQ